MPGWQRLQSFSGNAILRWHTPQNWLSRFLSMARIQSILFPNGAAGNFIAKALNFSLLTFVPPLWHRLQFSPSGPFGANAVLPLWQFPQYLPSLMSVSVIGVSPAFMLKSSSE